MKKVMEDIKVYTGAEKLKASKSFGISRMEEVYEKNQGKVDAPHRHDYYTVLLVQKASGKHIVDFTAHTLTGHQVFFIAPGQVHQVLEDDKSYGFSIIFSTQFLAENNISLDFIEALHLFQDYGNHPPLSISDGELEKLSFFCEEMLSLYQSSIKFNAQAIGAYLKLFFIHCNNLCSVSFDEVEAEASGFSTLKKFKTLLNEKHSEWHATSQYADALHISADHLNRIVKSLTQKTAKEMIQSRIVFAAKRLLYFTELSSKEIGYKLGFTEPTNFSAFFKNCTGVSPSKFKESN